VTLSHSLPISCGVTEVLQGPQFITGQLSDTSPAGADIYLAVYAHAMKASLTALAALSTLAAFAPVAHADSSADFLASLDKAQISYSDPTTATNLGNTICQQLHSNADPTTAATTAVNAGYPAYQAGKILFIASHTLCPDTAAAVEKWSNTP
jgi:hypothetical protein